MRERNVEQYLVDQVKALGGEIRKLEWIGRNGAPDRFVMLRGGRFVELKRPGKGLEAHQKREHKRMNEHGVYTWTLSTFEQVDNFINSIMSEPNNVA